MAVTWDVVGLDSIKTVGSLSDVVTRVHWTATKSETVGSDTYTGKRLGVVDLADPDQSSFTAYTSIPKSDAISWAKNALGTDEITSIETSIDTQITEAKTANRIYEVPW